VSRVYGANAVGEVLTHAPGAVERLLVPRGEREGPLVAQAHAAGVPVVSVSRAELQRRAGGRGGVGLAADIRIASPPPLDALGGPGFLGVALDGVTDPHNLGAIVRSAAALGADAVIVPTRGSAPLNDAAVRASAGAVAYLPVLRVVNLARAIRALREAGVWSWAAAPEADRSLYAVDLREPSLLVLGAEGPGLRPNVARACDGAVSLPLGGAVASLNVSVFAGVALSEAARQRALTHRDESVVARGRFRS